MASPRLRWGAGAAAAAAGIGGAVLLGALRPGPATLHMGAHLVLMNAVAPLAVLALRDRHRAGAAASGGALAAATAVQAVALWAAHAPPLLDLAVRSPAAHAGAQAALLGAALWFWRAVLAQQGADRWRAIVALLLTAKLFCLLGALLVLAPRPIYAVHSGPHHPVVPSGLTALEDQQLAGLLMLAACALTYVAAGAIIAARWLRELVAQGTSPHGASPVRQA